MKQPNHDSSSEDPDEKTLRGNDREQDVETGDAETVDENSDESSETRLNDLSTRSSTNMQEEEEEESVEEKEQSFNPAIELGSDDSPAANSTQNDNSSVCVEAIVVEEGNAPSERTLASAQVVLDTATSERRRLWTERLPVATPILDAEVQVWDYSRPTYQRRFGQGLWGPISGQTQDQGSERPPRDPIFTQEDRANPFRCCCKVIGITVALPFYAVYFIFCQADVWGPTVCQFLDCILVRPPGMLLDGVVCGLSYISWALFKIVVVPLYTLLVYLKRFLRNMLLCLVKFGLVWPLERIYFYGLVPLMTCFHQCIILPIIAGIVMVYAFVAYKLVQPCVQGICDVFVAIWAKLLKPCLAGVREGFIATGNALVATVSCINNKVLVPCMIAIRDFVVAIGMGIMAVVTFVGKGIQAFFMAIHTYLLLPCGKGIQACGKAIYTNLLLPVGQAVKSCYTRIWNALTATCQWIYASISACFTAIYKNILQPCGKGIFWAIAGVFTGIFIVIRFVFYVALWQHMIVPAYKGLVGGIQWTYRNFWVPLGQGLYGYLVQPIGRAFRAIGSGIYAVVQAIGNVLKSIGQAIASVFRSIGQAIRGVGVAIANIF